ncbi:FBP domain-containing protein [Leifsonia poae]|uniref:FBP domain-containing protein n=1 Tax=Leifsonia poae TaxID=110933 RepID=UPI001CBD723E|nr:FBP domain-containing protein [Leifsonia poae]
MEMLSQQEIRDAFVNCSRTEAAELPMPPGLHEVDWSRREYLGWRDPRSPQRGFVVVPTVDSPVGIVLRASDASMRSHSASMCGWCQDVQLTHDVYLYVARRAGQAGRNGDTVGTMLCGDFDCCENVRRKPSPAVVGFDVEAAVAARIAGLGERAQRFAATVVGARI